MDVVNQIKLEPIEIKDECEVGPVKLESFATEDEESVCYDPCEISPPFTHSDIQTDQALSDSTRKIRKLKSKNNRYENNNLHNNVVLFQENFAHDDYMSKVTLEDYQTLTKKFCPSKQLAKFINMQVKQVSKRSKGRRYTEEYKIYCLAMYCRNPKLYKNLLTDKFCLPSDTTLRRYLCNLHISPGINENVFKILKNKIQNFDHYDKFCIVCLDDILLKPNLFYATDSDRIVGFENFGVNKLRFKPARKATVVMVKGLKANWVQAVAYFLTNSNFSPANLKIILFKIIEELFRIGVTVLALVTNVDLIFYSFAQHLGVSPDQPHFICADRKIAFLFDPPNLLKSTRNILMKHDIIWNDSKISWDYIKKVYEDDKTYGSERTLTFLTDAHVFPNDIKKLKTDFVAEIFDSRLANCMNLYIRFKPDLVPLQAKATAHFLEMLNNLYEMLNTPTAHESSSGSSLLQKDFLVKCSDTFQKLGLDNEDITSSIKCFEEWSITIRGLLNLNKLTRRHFVWCTLMKRANQECLTNFFDTLREHGGITGRPTAIKFVRSFKKLFHKNLVNSGRASYREDEMTIFMKVKDIQKNALRGIQQYTLDEPESLVPIEKKSKPDMDYQNLVIFKNDFTSIVLNYLLTKSLENHSCGICIEYAHCERRIEHFRQNIDQTYGESELRMKLKRSTSNFSELILLMESIFQSHFEKLALQKLVVEKLIKLFTKIRFVHPCNHFELEFVYKLYARMRLYHSLKLSNQYFKKHSEDRKLIVWKPI